MINKIRTLLDVFDDIKPDDYDICIKNTKNVLVVFELPNNISNVQIYV